MEEKKAWDAIVIGSGLGGMACATSLAKCGWKVLILEQHYVAGGCSHTFTRKGFHWDVGVHCVGQVAPGDATSKVIDWITDGKMRFEQIQGGYDRIYLPGGFELALSNNREEFIQALKDKFPEHHLAIDSYFTAVQKAANAAAFYFGGRVLPSWADGAFSSIARVLGKEWWFRTTDEVLHEVAPGPAAAKLRSVLTSQWGYYGATPKESSFMVHALTVKHFWNGGYYPVGTAKTYADTFLAPLKDAGGEVRLRASVKEVIIEGGKATGVRLENGEEIFAKVVISGVGARATSEKLLPDSVRDEMWAKNLRGLKQSPTYLTLYIGFEGDVEAAGATHANQWRYESWDMEWKEWDVSDPNSKPPFLFLSFPSLKDPAHVPGPTRKHTGEAITFVPWSAFEKWKHTRRGYRDPEYSEFKKSVQERFLAHYRKALPKLAELITYVELSTPLSTAHFIRAPEGAIYGLDPIPARFRARELRTRTPVKNLYMTGADVAILGVAGAITGGLLTAGTLEPRLLTKLL